MADLRSEQKKMLAREIYLLGNYTYEEIAQKVGAQRQTISRWAKAGNWDNLKAGMTVTREAILSRMYQQLNNMNSAILEREPSKRHPDTKEADVMVKLPRQLKTWKQMSVSATLLVSECALANFFDASTWIRQRSMLNYGTCS